RATSTTSLATLMMSESMDISWIAKQSVNDPGFAAVDQFLQTARALRFNRGRDLAGEHSLIGRSLDCAKYSHRHGIFGKLHSSKNVRQTGLVSIFVVNEDVVNCYAVFANSDDFRRHAVQTNSLTFVLAEEQRLAVFELQHPVFLDLALVE